MALESLKAAGKAIRNSPKAIRKKFTGGHESLSGHDKLDEDWYHSDDPINAGITFYVKYLGSTPVTKTHGPGSTDDAVKTIVHHAKSRGGKLQKVQMTISSRFLKLEDIQGQSKLEDIPLYRVSYCTVDPYYDKVFCYISRNSGTKKLECHAFLCSKKSKAEAITLTVAQAFNIAFERWQAHKKRKEADKKVREEAAAFHSAGASMGNGSVPSPVHVKNGGDDLLGVELTSPLPLQPAIITPPPQVIEPTPLDEVVQGMDQIKVTTASPPTTSSQPTNPFVSMDDSHINTSNSDLLSVKTTMTKAVSLDYLKIEDDLDFEFTKLAEARSNPHLLAIGSHLDRSNTDHDVASHMYGDKTADELTMTKSIDDLLMY